MSILKKIGKTVEKAFYKVEEKNRVTAQVNRLRAIMKREERAAEKEYITLGRYYYQNLRDSQNPVTEKHCAEIDEIEKRINRSLDQLENIYYRIAKAKKEEIEEVTLDDVEEVVPPKEEKEDLPFAEENTENNQ